MNSELHGHHHYQLVLLLNGWYQFDLSLESTNVECCNKPVQPNQLETHETPLSWCCGMGSKKLYYGSIWHHEQICLQPV